MDQILKTILLSSLTVLISVLVIFAVVKAGSLAPTSNPQATLYTLSDIYTRLTTNAAATEASHTLQPAGSPAGTFYTLKQIYDAVPTIDASKVLSGTTYLGVAGTITNGSNVTGSNGSLSISIPTGYYSGKTATASDTNLIQSNIKNGTTIFGVTGNLSSISLSPMTNGTADSSILPAGVYTSALGGVDDYNAGAAMPSDSYKSTWVACHAGTSPNNAGNNWCGTSDPANAEKIDSNTGLVWSKWLDSGVGHTWFWANSCYSPGTVQNPGDCSNNGDAACQCLKLPVGSMTGCDAQTGWRLPDQKELMQAYIDGAYGNLSSADNNFWSSTTRSNYTPNSWYVILLYGYTNYATKPNPMTVRCVR